MLPKPLETYLAPMMRETCRTVEPDPNCIFCKGSGKKADGEFCPCLGRDDGLF